MRVFLIALLLAGTALADGPTWELVWRQGYNYPGHGQGYAAFRIVRGSDSARYETADGTCVTWTLERADEFLRGLRSRGLEYEIRADEHGGWYAGRLFWWKDLGPNGTLLTFRSADLKMSTALVPVNRNIRESDWFDFFRHSVPVWNSTSLEDSELPEWARYECVR